MKNKRIIVYPLCIALIICGIYNLWIIKKSTNETNELYLSMAEQVHEEQEETTVSAADEHTYSSSDVEAGQYEPVINPWLTKLQEQNSELAAWITIPDTVIDYPVMQTRIDNDFYLTHNFEKKKEKHGTPFVDVSCNIKTSDNIIIYGHHMNDGTMFQNLMFYKDSEFCEKNQNVFLYTPWDNRNYELAYVILITSEEANDFPYYRFTEFENRNSFDNYLEQCEKYALWKNRKLPQYGNKLLTLSTCEYSRKDGRLVIIASTDETEK